MRWRLFEVMRERNARLYLGAVLVSGFGDTAMLLAAGIWVRTLTGSNSLAALVGFCMWLPTFAGPVIGAIADRVPRRQLLVAVNLALAAVMTTLLAVRSQGEAWLVFPVLALIGAGMVLTNAAETALLASAVPEEMRGGFNGLVRSAIELMKLVAPLAGAGLFTVFGGPAVALVDAVTFVVAAATFQRIRAEEGPRQVRPQRSWRADSAEGIRYLWNHRLLRALVVSAATVMVLAGLSTTATFAILDSGLHRAPAFAGVLTAVQGLGSLVGGLATGGLMRRLSPRALSAAGLAIFAVGVLARATPWLPVVLGGTFALGVGVPWPVIVALTSLQKETPRELLGRVAASANTLMYAPTGLALLLGTGLVAALDYRIQIIAAGAGGLVVATALALTARTAPTPAPASPTPPATLPVAAAASE